MLLSMGIFFQDVPAGGFEKKMDGIYEMSEEKQTCISVKSPDEFTIKVKSNPSTGYSWSLDQPLDETAFRLIGRDMEAPINTGIVGAPQYEIWKFKTLKSGRFIIDLNYSRSWENNIPPLKTHRFIILVE
jgi:predicted secreted protein